MYVYIPFINTVLVNMYTHKIYIYMKICTVIYMMILWLRLAKGNSNITTTRVELSLPTGCRNWLKGAEFSPGSTCWLPATLVMFQFHLHFMFTISSTLDDFFLERKTPLKALEEVIACDFSWNFCLATSNSRSWHCELSLKVRYSHRCLFLVMVHSQNGSVLHVAIFGPQNWYWVWSWDILMSSISAGETNTERSSSMFGTFPPHRIWSIHQLFVELTVPPVIVLDFW